MPVRSAEVTFLPPHSRDAEKLLPAIQGSDPALMSPAHLSAQQDWKLAETGYTPSYAAATIEIDDSGLGEITAPKFRFWKPDPVWVQSTSIPKPHRSPSIPTTVTGSGELAGRMFSPAARPVYKIPPGQTLQPAEFLVSVSEDGKVLHAFILSSSMNEALNRAAMQVLLAGKFSPASAPAWGNVIFHWGNDVAREKAP